MSKVFEFPSFGDGDDDYTIQDGITIRPVSNGYILEVQNDEEDLTEVYLDKKKLIDRLNELL